MFILEESQLIEDTIRDSAVLKLYKSVRQLESSNDRDLFIEQVIAHEKCVNLIEILVEFQTPKGFSINDHSTDVKLKLSVEERQQICDKLNLEMNDLACFILVLSATLTQLFVIDNYIGPTKEDTLDNHYANLPQAFSQIREQVDFKALSIDGSEVYHKILSPWLLRLVQLCWVLLDGLRCSRRLLELEFLVWKNRYLTIHQTILHEPSEAILQDSRKLQEYIFDHHIIDRGQENNTQLTRFDVVELCCELVQSALLRDGLTYSRKFFDYASEFSGISIEHTGVLGKRTKFQRNDIAQLVIKVNKSAKGDPKAEVLVKSDLPQDVELDDDTLLPDVSFVAENESGESIETEQDLSVQAQVLMLTKLDIILRSDVMEESLKDEWTLAYLRSIIKASSVWSVKYKALAIRSSVEKKHTRKMSRALMQLETLVKANEESSGTSSSRLRSFYSALPLSSWLLQKSFGDISLDLGLYKNALDLYQRIEYWDGIIKCLCAIGQVVKAEEVIRQELAKEETAYLYCLLGDVTDKIEYYEKSWVLSKNRLARAQKSIGTYYYVRKQHEKAIEHYELAAKTNPSNVSILSMLAYSYLTIENYDKAAEYYRNITYHDDGNFLAWNNLSKAYIKLNQKERAWRTLQEAIKCNFEEWKIWENFMIVSTEIGAWEDVVTAWNRLIDIKSSHKDDQVLSGLTYTLMKVPLDKVSPEYAKLLKDSLKLVARLNATSDCSPRLWICYFKLLMREYQVTIPKSKQKTNEKFTDYEIDSRISKVVNALQRATPTTLTGETDWIKEPTKVYRVLDSYDELIECYSYAFEMLGTRTDIWRQWKYLKLSFSNTKKILEKKGYNHAQ